MDFKEFRKKNREKRKVFKLHSLIAMASLAIFIVLLVLPIEFRYDEIYFLLLVHFILSFIFDKELRAKIASFFKKSP